MASPGSYQQGQLSPTGLSINLSSKNPFRNRAASPASVEAAFASPGTSPFNDPPSQRPLSRNPFLDQPPPAMKSPGSVETKAEHKSMSAQEIFDSLTLDDKKAHEPLIPGLASERRPSDQSSARPRPGQQRPSSNHRPTRSQEEALRARKALAPAMRPTASRSPQRKPQRRPRRNSDSSVMDFSTQPITQEEMKMIEAKRMRDRLRREREGRETREPREPREPREAREKREGREEGESKDKKARDGKERSKSGKTSRRLDIIDQLDATSIYGTGLFHHDGPFDALNPHRNRQSSRRAPMHAFPKDSLNNSLGGAGPLNRNPDHRTFMGNGTDEAFHDYAGASKNKNGYNFPTSTAEPAIFDPVARGSIVHGDESYGLGTSTFLEGTPAAKAAITRRHEEQQKEFVEGGGLQRKKSLAQRIRHMNKGPREIGPSGRITSPEGAYSKRSPDAMPGSSVGNEANPFFAEFTKGEETISVKPRDGSKSPLSPPAIPRRLSGAPLERRATTDATSTPEDNTPPAKPIGILGRMKSLKGGRRPKNTDISNAQATSPGTAM